MRATWAGSAACIAVAAACSDTAPARAQLVIVVDTDAHVVGELDARPEVSRDAAIDTLRVDILDAQNHEVDLRTFVVADPGSWPLSFGIEPSAAFGGEVRVWIRAFRATFAATGTAANGATTLDPLPQVALDRLVAVPFPSSGVETVAVTLRTDCMGTPSSFGSPMTTCIDASQPSADPRSGIDVSTGAAPSASSVGTWAPAVEVPCSATAGPQQRCIPGGFFILGDLDAVGAGYTTAYEPVPLRPVVVSPFLLDQDEFTVGKLRALVGSGAFSGALPTPATPADQYEQFCTWLGKDDGTNDALPLNCVPYATAQALCAMSSGGAGHGALPTEAQWEYAARGRGERLRYPWGDTEPQCCSASLDRAGPPGIPTACPGRGLEPVGSHPVSSSCAGTGDVSRDGVDDLAGSVSELLGDSEQAFTAPCWTAQAILHDPTCQASNAAFGMRGSFWNAGTGTALLALRNSAIGAGQPSAGFRCAYPDGAP